MGKVVGREAELRAVRSLVAAATDGHGGVLALVGPAGIGKSLLLEAVVNGTRGTRTLRVVGVEAERELPFAGLWSLVLPLLAHGEALTDAQRLALSVVTGRAEGAAPGRMVLGGAFLALLSAAAEEHPVLVVVDDLQWIDRPSAETVIFAARRLRDERVAVVLASRPPDALDSLDEDDVGTLLRSVPTLSLSGLSAAQAPRLLPGVAAQVAAALAERSGGNPLAMLEAASLLEPEVLSGTRRMPQNLPVTGADATYRLRLAGLTPPAREGCRVMALAGRAPGDLVVEALTKVSVSVSDLSEVEEAGLGRLTVDGVQWRHPLARSAAAEGSVDQVRRIHAVLAECWSGVPGSRPQWAWHRAESVWGPDQSAADALADVARLSAEREASLEAADAWERAAVLGEDPVLRRQWLGLAARAAFRGGASARAAHLYDLALDDGPDPAAPEARAVLLHERGRVEHGLGRPVRAYDLLISAARSSVGRRATMAAAEAVHAAMYARRADLAQVAAAAAGAAHDPAHPIERFLVLHAEGAAAALAGDQQVARQRMSAATSLLLERRLLENEPDLLLWAVNADLFLDSMPPPLHPSVLATVNRVRESGELVWSPRVVRLVGVRDLLRGAWGLACAAAEDATELARLAGQRTQVAEGLLLQAEIEAARGQADRCLTHTDEAGTIVADLEVRWLADHVWSTRALLRLTLGQPAAAAECFARTSQPGHEVTNGLVESLVLAGRADEAADLLTRAGDAAGSGSVARCLLDRDEPAARRLTEHADIAVSTFDAARLRLTAGTVLRRLGARSDARRQLRLAETTFTELSTLPWLERVQAELRASGATLRRRPEGQELTAAERRVASLVAEGRSNKEVAQALFLSPKTVEFHLGRAFRKLGVQNRTTLAARHGELLLGSGVEPVGQGPE